MWTAPYALYSGTLTTTPVAGATVDLMATCPKHAIEVAVTVSSGGDTLFVLDGSLDGVNWYSISPPTDAGTGVTAAINAYNVVARYVRVAIWVTAGTATATVTGASGTE